MTSDPFPSPEAIEAAGIAMRDGHPHFVFSDAWAADILAAAVKVQPVVALPPCPKCNGLKCDPHTYDDPPCPSCKGSGVDRLIAESEIREWAAAMSTAPWTVEARGDGIPEGYLVAMRDLARWLDEREEDLSLMEPTPLTLAVHKALLDEIANERSKPSGEGTHA